MTEKEVAAQERRIFLSELTRRLLIVAVSLFMIGSMATLVYLAIQNNTQIKRTTELQTTIKDCVKPTGRCYRENLAARATLTSDINNNSAAAAACAVAAPFDAAYRVRYKIIRDCIEETVK